MNSNAQDKVDGKDVAQVSITEDADLKLKDIFSITKYFAYEMDIYKFAVAVALAHDLCNQSLKNKKFKGKSKVKFSVSTLDTDGSLKMLITLISPQYSGRPYQYSQWLAISGINYLHKELVDNNRPIIDVLDIEK